MLEAEFQSPRSGKFVSNPFVMNLLAINRRTMFQSPRSGKFVSNATYGIDDNKIKAKVLVSIP